MLIGYGTKSFNDVYLLFKKDNEYNEYLKNETTPHIEFRAKDYVDFHTGTTETQSYNQVDIDYLTIITQAVVDFENGDIVVDKDSRTQWRIESVVVKDDNRSKEYSRRPRKYTILTLRK